MSSSLELLDCASSWALLTDPSFLWSALIMSNQYLGEKGGLGVEQGPNKPNALKMQRLELQPQLSLQREANVRTWNFKKNKWKLFGVFFFWQRGQEIYPLSGALSSSSVYSDVNKLICYKEVSDCSEVCRPHRGKTPFQREREVKSFSERF